jgi:hypothetical protein
LPLLNFHLGHLCPSPLDRKPILVSNLLSKHGQAIFGKERLYQVRRNGAIIRILFASRSALECETLTNRGHLFRRVHGSSKTDIGFLKSARARQSMGSGAFQNAGTQSSMSAVVRIDFRHRVKIGNTTQFLPTRWKVMVSMLRRTDRIVATSISRRRMRNPCTTAH